VTWLRAQRTADAVNARLHASLHARLPAALPISIAKTKTSDP